MRDSHSARGKTAGARVPGDWQPRHVRGSIDDIAWGGWRLDPGRPLAHLALARLRVCRDQQLALRTLQGYDGTAGAFIRFIENELALAGTPRVATVGDLTTEAIYRYLARPAARGGSLQIGAKRSEGGALRGLASFGIEIGAVSADALRAFRLPKPARSAIPTTLSDDDIRRLERRLAADTTYEGVRLHLWSRLGLDTGLRPAEEAGIRLADIDQVERSIRIRGKGAKKRTVYYGAGTAALLERYLRVRGPSRYAELFLGHRGPVGPEAASKAFRSLADELGLVALGDPDDEPESATLYILRRTFARCFADKGGQVEELARLLGHEPSSIPMLLRCYYRPSDERLRAAHQRIRPIDSLFDDEAA
jgi:integrase/recombinase XerC